MTTATAIKMAAAAAGVLTLGLAGTPGAAADDYPNIQRFGVQEELVDAGGTVVQGWTVSNLRPSSDAVGWPVRGQLWEANATVRALQGCPMPIVSNFNARAGNGQDYQVLATANAPQGVSARTICAPDHSTGKLYFDVVGPVPDGVVYNAGGRDLLIWRK